METKDRRKAVWTEILYRREKQWSIFSWTASLLLASIGGIVALATKEGFELSTLHKSFLATALFLLTLYAAVWLGVNLHLEMKAVEGWPDVMSAGLSERPSRVREGMCRGLSLKPYARA